MRIFSPRCGSPWRRLRRIAVLLTPIAALGLTGCLPDFLSGKSADSKSSSDSTTTGQVNRSQKTGSFGAEAEQQVTSTRHLKQGREIQKVETRATSASLQRGPGPGRLGSVVSRPAGPKTIATDVAANRALANFYSVLARLESAALQRPITILHLGDERIVMDRFGGDLREVFHSRFGDAGRGMMSPGQPFPHYRARGMQVHQTGTWTVANSLAGDTGPFGLTGVRLTSGAPKSSVSLTDLKGQFGWAEISFLAGPRQGTAIVSVEDEDGNDVIRQIVETTAGGLQIKRLRLNQAGRTLKVTAGDSGSVTLLSWAVGRSKPGIRYVSLGVPNATAGIAQLWDATLVGQELQQLKPDLIILSYGTNESFDDKLNVAIYESGISETISHLKTLAPQASLLMLGPPDVARLPDHAGRISGAAKSVPCRRLNAEEIRTYSERIRASDRQLERWHPPVLLDQVRSVLRRVAARNGTFFWDWSKVMGGSCGIHAWVHRSPPLAAPNHRNLTDAGAKQSALLLFQELMSGYASFRRLARQ